MSWTAGEVLKRNEGKADGGGEQEVIRQNSDQILVIGMILLSGVNAWALVGAIVVAC